MPRPSPRLETLAAFLLLGLGNLNAVTHDIGTGLSKLEPLLKEYCIRCHGGEETEADIDLSGALTQLRLLQDRDIWLSVIEQIESEEMPPKKPFPAPDEVTAIVSRIDTAINEVDWTALHDPGRVSLSRLTRLEYQNAVRDVFGIDLQAGHFLGNDPEGNTGFTNDREALTFPLFAFDDFLREAERAADSIMAYGEPKWVRDIPMVQAVKESKIDAHIHRDGKALVIEDENVPFYLPIEVPHTGLYDLEIRAWTFDREPLAGLGVFLDGALVKALVIQGEEPRSYWLRLNMTQGAHVMSFGYNRERAPIVQSRITPRTVPAKLSDTVLKNSVPRVDLPPHLRGNQEALAAFEKLNHTLAAYKLTADLARKLLDEGAADYEFHGMKHPAAGAVLTSKLNGFSPSKVPFNLAAGKVAVFLDIPQKKLETQIQNEFGYSHEQYAKTARAYLDAFAEKHPERVRKQPGKIAIKRIQLASHSLADTETAPDWLITDQRDFESAAPALKKLAHRAYARPARPVEIDALQSIYQQTLDETQSPKAAFRDAIVGLLVSPPFLLRHTEGPDAEQFEVPAVELAKRLSHFLWLSIPDEELRQAAAADQLKNPPVLKAQVERMIADPKFEAFAAAFTEQWLNLSNLAQVEGLDINLKEAMQAEPTLLIRDLFRENRSTLELVDARHSYLTGKLADHYDLSPVESIQPRKVELQTDQRGGLLTMGAMLASTSAGKRTSPVNRGAWIVELLLGEHLPPAPASVPELKTDNQKRTVREELELHRQAPECAGCHSKIDPYGFVLEHYDPLGAWRDKDKGKPVNATTTLDDGTAVDGLNEFKAYVLKHRQEDVVRNLIERLLEFALGRKLRFTDEATVRKLLQQARASDYRARDILIHLVNSDAFLEQNNAPRSSAAVR